VPKASWAASGSALPAGQGGDPSPLLSTGETALESWVQFWAPQSKRLGHTGAGPPKGHEDDYGLGAPDVQAVRTKELEKRRLSGRNLIHVNKYPVGASKECRMRLFSVMPSDKSSGNRYELEHS